MPVHTSLQPIPTAHLFRPLADELLALLRALAPEQWTRRTSAGEWTVHDVVAHLLDGDLRRISATRDAHPPPPPDRPIEGYSALMEYLDALNAQWVRAARRISPHVLCDLLAATAPLLADVLQAADPLADATYPVAWTGQDASPMWLDIGREYTERWHHQDQIREAVGAPPLGQPHWLRPVLDISLLALPHAWRDVRPAAGTRVALHVRGASGGSWYLSYAPSWRLHAGNVQGAAATIVVDDLALARLLLHRLAADAARAAISIDGDASLAAPIVTARAVMASAAQPDSTRAPDADSHKEIA